MPAMTTSYELEQAPLTVPGIPSCPCPACWQPIQAQRLRLTYTKPPTHLPTHWHNTNPAAPAAQDKYHLYFLFDLMSGGDLMDVLVAEARVIKLRVAKGALQRGCFAPKVRPRRESGHVGSWGRVLDPVRQGALWREGQAGSAWQSSSTGQHATSKCPPAAEWCCCRGWPCPGAGEGAQGHGGGPGALLRRLHRPGAGVPARPQHWCVIGVGVGGWSSGWVGGRGVRPKGGKSVGVERAVKEQGHGEEELGEQAGQEKGGVERRKSVRRREQK